MAMDPAEKALKRIFKKIVDEGIDSNYEYQSILKNHHPSVSFLNNRLMGFAGDILNIRQAFYDEGTKSKLISRAISRGVLKVIRLGKGKLLIHMWHLCYLESNFSSSMSTGYRGREGGRVMEVRTQSSKSLKMMWKIAGTDSGNIKSVRIVGGEERK